MAYIEVRTTLPDHKKAKAMARDVGMRRPWVVGHLVCIWTWALENVPSNGSLAGIEDVDLEEAAQWPEERAGELVPAMVRAGFIEVDRTGRFIHDWDEYAGRLLRRREEDRARKAAERAAARATRSKPSASRPADTARRPADTPPVSGGQTPESAPPARRHAPARAVAPHRTAPTPSGGTEPEEAPPARRRGSAKRPAAAGDPPAFDPTERPDLAALTDRGWRFSPAQADSLAEVASFERTGGDADRRSGFATVAGWIRDAPTTGDLLEHVFATSTRLRRERMAKATPPANGSAKPIARATAIAKLREYRGRVDAEQWARLLERYHVSEADLEDEIDWNEPAAARSSTHGAAQT